MSTHNAAVMPINQMVKALTKQADDNDQLGKILSSKEHEKITELLQGFKVDGSVIEGVEDVILQAEKEGFALGVRYGMRHLANLQEWIR